jgi:hypothetical protein
MKGAADTFAELLAALHAQSRRQDEALTGLDLAVSDFRSFGGGVIEEMQQDVEKRALGVLRELEAGLKTTKDALEHQVGGAKKGILIVLMRR